MSEGTGLSRDLRVNEMIRVPNVRVVDEEGSQLGVLPTHQALRVAQERGFDLVEVAPNASPPVVKFLDYGQFKYEQARKEKEARRHQRSVEFKEIRLKPKIGKGDFDTKVRRAIEFLEDGDRVKVTVQFRGREVSHAYIGRDLLVRFGDLIKDHGAVERQPLLEGKSMSMTVASTHKPKTIPSVPRTDGAQAPDAPAPPSPSSTPPAAPQAPEAPPTTPAAGG
jgi:translation initiation factor IF-3